MATFYEKCNSDVMELGARIMRAYQPELIEYDVRITYLFASSSTDRPAVSVGGYPCYAKVKIVPLVQRADGRADAEIVIDKLAWESADDVQREAMLAHELWHLDLHRKDGTPQFDDAGRPKLKMRKHDVQHGWFHAIADRYGDSSVEVLQAKQFADKHGQLYFGWSAPPDRHIESAVA